MIGSPTHGTLDLLVPWPIWIFILLSSLCSVAAAAYQKWNLLSRKRTLMCRKKTVDGKEKWEFKNHLATSPDGITWKSVPEPLLPLGSKGGWDSESHAGPCILKFADGYHMWYLGSGPYNGKTAWRIGHATSPDGLKWTRSGEEPVPDIGKPGGWDGTFP